MGLSRRESPCERCGWRYSGYHVCFDASKPCPGEGVVDPNAEKKKKIRAANGKLGGISAAGRESIAQSTSERWARYREESRPRDEKLLAKYREGAGLRELADEFKMSHSTVMKVIRREEADTGEVIMRPRGLNYRHDKSREVHGGFN